MYKYIGAILAHISNMYLIKKKPMRYLYNFLTVMAFLCLTKAFAEQQAPFDQNSFYDVVNCNSKDLTQKDIIKLISDPKNKIESIDKLISFLPPCYKLNYTAVYNSKSVHCATVSAPRILTYGKTGKLVCSFNSGEKSDYKIFYDSQSTKDCHENALECIEFNEAKKRFEFFEVEFAKTDKGELITEDITKPQINTNPKTCLKCHQGNSEWPEGRPLIGSYFMWPGMYGSADDDIFSELHSDSTHNEFQMYLEKFDSKMKANERYSQLAQFFRVNSLNEVVPSKFHQPNSNLQELLSELNTKRIGKILDLKKNILSPFRSAIVAALFCSEQNKNPDFILDFLPHDVTSQFRAIDEFKNRNLNLFRNYNQLTLDLQFQLTGERYSRSEYLYKTLENFEMKNYMEIQKSDQNLHWTTPFTYILENLGVSTEGMSMTTIPSLEFVQGIGTVNGDLAKYLFNSFFDKDDNILDYSMIEQPDTLCKKLKEKSLLELNSLNWELFYSQIKPVFSFSNSNQSLINEDTNRPQVLQKVCMQCHNPNLSIPDFSSGKAIRKTFLDQPNFIKKLEKMIYRDSATGLCQMPLYGNCLTDEESKAIKSYFENVLK